VSRADRPVLAVLVAGFTLAFSLYSLFRHWQFNTSYDLGIFDQAVWHLSRFEAPASTISGFSNILGDHFYPIILLFVPFYWIAPAPETLLIIQAALFAASIVPVFSFLQRRLPRPAAYALAVACLLFWGIQRAAAADVHEVAFAPLVIASAVDALDRRRWGVFSLLAVLLVCIKEDLIPLLGGFGVILVVEGERRKGLALVAASIIVFVAVIGLVVPWFSDAGRSAYVPLPGAWADMLWTLPVRLVTPAVKLQTMLLWFAPFLFLSLASPLSVLVMSIALTRLLSDNANHWGASFHYSAPLAPLLAMSAGDGLARLKTRLAEKRVGASTIGRVITLAAVASLLLCAFLPGRQPLWRVFAPRHYRPSPQSLTAREALAVIPDTASVVAQAAILPHLSQRNAVYVLGRESPAAEYVVAAADLNPWPVADRRALLALLTDRQRHGYTVAFDKAGWVVLRREPVPAARPTGQ